MRPLIQKEKKHKASILRCHAVHSLWPHKLSEHSASQSFKFSAMQMENQIN